MYGAKCSSKHLQVLLPFLQTQLLFALHGQDLPRIIVILNLLPILAPWKGFRMSLGLHVKVLALVTGQWLALSIWLPTCFAVGAPRSGRMMI